MKFLNPNLLTTDPIPQAGPYIAFRELSSLSTIYDSYGAVIYGVLFRVAHQDIFLADNLMEKVFAAINREFDSLVEFKRSGFIWILDILTKTLKDNGYYPDLSFQDKVSFLQSS